MESHVLLTVTAVKNQNEESFQFHLLRQSEPLEFEVITQGRQIEGSKSSDLNIKRNVTSF